MTAARVRQAHVFVGIPTQPKFLKALSLLRPFLNSADYRMRVRGRGPKKPELRGRWGDVHLEDAKTVSIYIDSRAAEDERTRLYQRYYSEQEVVAQLREANEHLNSAILLAETNLAAAQAEAHRLKGELDGVPLWLRDLCRFFRKQEAA